MQIKLKSNIDSLLTDRDGEKVTDQTALTPFVKENLGKVVEANIFNMTRYKQLKSSGMDSQQLETLKFMAENSMTMSVRTPDGKNMPIHNSWIAEIEGETIKPEINPLKNLFQVTANKFIDRDANKIVDAADVKICVACGNTLDHSKHKTLCKSCFDKKYFDIKSSSYKPSPVFFGTQAGTLAKSNPAWYGIELEYALKSKDKMANFVWAYEDEIYLKYDGSIRGSDIKAEMVTHPASFSHLMSDSSWVSNISKIDDVSNAESNGCHIHISRSAFKSNKHYAKFKFMIIENEPLITTIGGRALTSYCCIKPDKTTMFMTDKDATQGEKYAIVNEQHKDTIELRFFASTSKVDQLKGYIQFMDSMLKYTAYYGDTATYEGYAKYLTKYKDTYPVMFKLLQSKPELFIGEVTFREPVIVEVNLKDLTAVDALTVTKLKFINVVGYEDGEERPVTNTGSTNIQFDRGRHYIHSAFGYSLQPNSTVICTVVRP